MASPQSISLGVSGILTGLNVGLCAKGFMSVGSDQLVPVHFGIFGDADLMGPRISLVLYPGISLAALGLSCIGSGFFPRAINQGKSESSTLATYMSAMGVVTNLTALYLQYASIEIARGKREPTIGGWAVLAVCAGLAIPSIVHFASSSYNKVESSHEVG